MKAAFTRLDPKNDIVFKMLFTSSERLLIALLTAVLNPPVAIQTAVVKNPELPKNFYDDKGSYLDILVTLDDGTILDVEMQCRPQAAFRERVLYYWAGAFSGQLVAGENYSALARVVSVLFLDHDEFDHADFHEIFRLRGQSCAGEFSNLLEIHTVELRKVRPSDSAALGRWCRFLASDDPLELRGLQIQDSDIAMAEKRLNEISADEKARHIILEQQRRDGARQIIAGALRKQAIAEGLAEGRAIGLTEGRVEGRVEGRAEGASNLLASLLELKFGTLPSEVLARLGNASELELGGWARRVLLADSLDGVFE